MADYPDPYISRLDRLDGIPHTATKNTYQRVQGILKEVQELLTGDRAQDYGDPLNMHTEIALRWDTEPHIAAYRMADMKQARLKHFPEHRDSALDAIAYLALGLAFSES